METRRLGDSDVEVSVVGLGCNQIGRRLDLEGTRAVVDAALDSGVTFFDTADIYGGAGRSEELLGEALEGRRDGVVIGTKFGMDMGDGKGPRGSAGYIRDAIEASLRRLRTDVIDLYQYHEPDGVTPIEETLGALDELVRAGKVRAVGCSKFDAGQLDEAARVAREQQYAHFVSVQEEYSLLRREADAELVPACERLGVSLIPFFPLARGLLTGKYRRGEPAPKGTRLAGSGAVATDADFDLVESLQQFAKERGLALLDVAVGGLAAQPTVASVIAGATKPEQVHANARAGRWKPSSDDLAVLDELTARRPATPKNSPPGSSSRS
jgi:aryl-alcohol dehydrogenase-like predicted oxidoreductase